MNRSSAVTDAMNAARDAAQQMVTAVFHGDRETAADIAIEYPHPEVLALVLTDLVAFVHDRWTRVLGGDTRNRNDGWVALMTDIEEWRNRS